MLTRITPASEKWYNVALRQTAIIDQHVQNIQSKLPTWDEIRRTRDTLLKVSDWTQAGDSPLSAEKKQEWAVYRQALRDLTESGDVNNIVWPQEP
jgi:uncharacterized protein YjiS (DUF1127 family)